MASTRIQHVINPERLAQQISALWPDKLVLGGSGAVLVDDDFLRDIEGGGTQVKIPRWKRLASFDNVVETAAFTRANLTSDAEYGYVCRKGKSYGVFDTAALTSLADPAAEIKEQLAQLIARAIDASLVSVLKGAVPSGNTHDPGVVTTGAGLTLQYEHIVDASVKLGDNADMITVIVMHSKVYGDALKANLVSFIDGAPYIMGKRIMVSDGTPKTADATPVYSCYLLGPQALYLKHQQMPLVEFDRDIEALCDIVAASVHFVPHLLGMSFSGTPAADVGPTDAELADTGNYTLKAQDTKSVRAVTLKIN